MVPSVPWSDEVVGHLNSISISAGHLDDGATVYTLVRLGGEVHEPCRVEPHSVRVGQQANDRTMYERHIAVRRMYDRELIGVENDTGSDRVNAQKVD